MKKIVILFVTAIFSLLYVIGVTQRSTLHAKAKQEIVTTKNEHSGSQLSDEDPWAEMNKIAERYINNSALTLSGNIRLYQYETPKMLEEQPFSYNKSGDNITYSIGSIEMAGNNRYSVVADNTEKVLSISPVQNHALPGKFFDIEKLKKILSDHKATAKVWLDKDQKMIVVENVDYEDIVNYRIYYSPGTYRINKIVLEMSTPDDLSEDTNTDQKEAVNREDTISNGNAEIDTLSVDRSFMPKMYDYTVEINYTDEKNVGQPGGDPLNKFVVINNKKISVTQQYKPYEFVNQVSKNSPATDEGK